MAKTPMAAQGCLLLHDLTASEGQMLSLCHALEEEGYPVSMPNLFGFVPRDAYDRTPHWQRWLNQAQEAYVELRGVCERVTVVGAGYGGVIATVIAEEYSVDGLVLLGCVLRPAGAAAALPLLISRSSALIPGILTRPVSWSASWNRGGV